MAGNRWRNPSTALRAVPLPAMRGGLIRQSPSTALAMMLRWISLEPPKIEVLRMLK